MSVTNSKIASVGLRAVILAPGGLAKLAGMVVLFFLSMPVSAAQWQTDILRDTFGYDDDAVSDVPLSEVQQGCGMRDCIPAIDRPVFVSAAEAGFLADDDLVMGIEIDGDARAYPVSILNFHEIVNDEIADEPVAITYCPLCGSGLAFERRVGDRVLEFGVSGLLRNNDLILYDRATESLWQQITGRAFVGPLRGEKLHALPVSLTAWSDWHTAHPDTRVLSTETGHRRPYHEKTPYGDYDRSERLLFPVAFDRRLHPKTVVHGVEIGPASFAVTEDILKSRVTVEQPGDPGVRWTMRPDGEVLAERMDTGERIVAHRMFWFAWYSFHTGTRIYTGDEG